MNNSLISSQLLAGAFVLTLGVIFVLSTIVQIRLQRARPFRDRSGAESDPGYLPDGSLSQITEVRVVEQAVIADFAARYSHSPTMQARVRNASLRKLK